MSATVLSGVLWKCKIGEWSGKTADDAVTEATTTLASSKVLDCSKVKASVANRVIDVSTSAGDACCAEMVLTTASTTTLTAETTVSTANGSATNMPVGWSNTKDTQIFWCLGKKGRGIASGDKMVEVTLSATVQPAYNTTPYAGTYTQKWSTRCSWDLPTVSCTKGDDKGCTDATKFVNKDTASCCFYAKTGTADPSKGQITILGDLSYPKAKDTEAYFCVRSADDRYVMGHTALKTKQTDATKNDFGYSIAVGIADYKFAAGYCAGATALQAVVGVAIIAAGLAL